MSKFYNLAKPLLFQLDPEEAHHLSIKAMALLGQMPMANFLCREWFKAKHQQPVKLWDLTFKNPVGLAAGFDKDARAWRGLSTLGFSHIELGTITPKPQAGNKRPRIFRLEEDDALINRLGFPSHGVERVLERLSIKKSDGLILGINIGKNKETPLEEAERDYLSLMGTLAPYADYLVINVSSPNTVGLRRLQARDNLEKLLNTLSKSRKKQAKSLGRHLPILVKIAPDLNLEELDDALSAIQDAEMDGIIATNTTIARPNSLRSLNRSQRGGLSGRALGEQSTKLIQHINKQTQGRLPLIGVGGIMSHADAQRKLDAGASLVQVYTGMIYGGPAWVGDMINHLKIKG